MRLTKRLTAVLLSLTILLAFPVSAKAKTTSGSIFDGKTYTHQAQFDNYKRYQGVDLSKHNGTVDFAKMKKAGVKYVILRAGYRGYAEEGTLNKDIKFDEYINAAIKQGLDIGIYFYSQAVSTTEAKNEAKYTVNLIKSYKKHITLPVAFDYEFAEVSSGRFDKRWKNGTLNKSKCTKIAMAYCDYIDDAGYDAMVYANKSFLSEVIDGNSIAKTYPIWMANYTTNTTYSGSFYIWQFSSTGKINGVSGSVDSNFLYSLKGLSPNKYEFTAAAIDKQEYTGSAIKPSVKVSYNGKTLTQNTDYKLTYSNNKNVGKAQVTITGINSYKDFLPKTVNFKIAPVRPAAAPVIVKRGPTSLKIKWDAQKDVNGYRVCYKKSGSWVHVGNTTKTEYTITGLSSAKLQTITILAYKTVDKVNYYSKKSPYAHIATKPAKVKNVTAAYKRGISMTLKWTKQSGADKYVVYKYSNAENDYIECCEVEGGKNNTAVINNLLPNTKYKFRVKAVKIAETGKEFSGKLSDVFSEYTTPPAPVLNTAESNAAKSITLSWEKSYGATGYQIMWSTSSTFANNNKTQKVTGVSTLKKAISTAQSKKYYYVKVRSYKERGSKVYYSPWSNKLSAKTK